MKCRIQITNPNTKKKIVHLPLSLRLRNQRGILGPDRPETPFLQRVDVPADAVVLPDRAAAANRVLAGRPVFPAAGAEQGARAGGVCVDGEHPAGDGSELHGVGGCRAGVQRVCEEEVSRVVDAV